MKTFRQHRIGYRSGYRSTLQNLSLCILSFFGLASISAICVGDTPASNPSSETVVETAKKKTAADKKPQPEPKQEKKDSAETPLAEKSLSLESEPDLPLGPIKPLSNRSIVYGLMWSQIEVDGLQEANPLAVRFSGIRRLPKSFAVDFQLLIGPAAVSQEQNFFDVPITVKTQIVGAGIFRLQKYFMPFQESLPNLQAILNLGYCYCVIKSTRPVPVEGEDFTYRLPFKAIDRGSFTYGAALSYRVDEKNAVTLELDRLVDDDRLTFTGLTFGWDRAF